MQLSAISSPNISRTRIDVSTTEMADLQVMSQLAAVMPDEGSIMGPTLALVTTTPTPTYRVRTPLRLPPHSEIDVSITMISDSATSFVCRTDVTGTIECFLRPLLEHLQGNAYVAKLFIRSMDLGESQVTVEVLRMTPVAKIIIDVVVTNDIHISRLSTSEYKPGESMHVSLGDRPAPALPYRPDFVPLHVARSNTSLGTSSIRMTQKDVADFYDNTLRPDVCLMNTTDAQLIDRLESVRESAYRSAYDSVYDYAQQQSLSAPPVSLAPSSRMTPSSRQYFGSERPPSINYSSARSHNLESSASRSAPYINNGCEPISVANMPYSTQCTSSSRKKFIRVLPSDCLFGPATASHPQTRIIRIRNIYSSDIRIDCAITSRSFTAERQDIHTELAPNCRAFEIISQFEYHIPCSAKTPENYVEIAVRFSPMQVTHVLHAAKLIINVAPDVSSDQNDNRAFQVPLLGIAGRPFLTLLGDDLSRYDSLIKIADQISLRLKNDGLAPAFVKIAAIIQPKVPNSDGYHRYRKSEAYNTIPDTCIIAPGCSKDIFVTRIGVSNKTPNEEEVVEIRYGHEGLRLLGMAYEGRGPWGDLIRRLQLREDPLRIMGQNIEKITVRLKQ